MGDESLDAFLEDGGKVNEEPVPEKRAHGWHCLKSQVLMSVLQSWLCRAGCLPPLSLPFLSQWGSERIKQDYMSEQCLAHCNRPESSCDGCFITVDILPRDSCWKHSSVKFQNGKCVLFILIFQGNIQSNGFHYGVFIRICRYALFLLIRTLTWSECVCLFIRLFSWLVWFSL